MEHGRNALSLLRIDNDGPVIVSSKLFDQDHHIDEIFGVLERPPKSVWSPSLR
jgi:hypothetical protein